MIAWLYLIGHKYLFQRQAERHFDRAYGHLFAGPSPTVDSRSAHRQAMLALVAKSVAEGLVVFQAWSGRVKYLARAGCVLFALAMLISMANIPVFKSALPYLSWSTLAIFMASLMLSVCQLHSCYKRYMEEYTLHWRVITFLFPLQAQVLLICTLGTSAVLLPGMMFPVVPIISIFLVTLGLQCFGATQLLDGLSQHPLQGDELQAYLQATVDCYPADALADLLMFELEGTVVSPQLLMTLQNGERQDSTV